jgi:integrase
MDLNLDRNLGPRVPVASPEVLRRLLVYRTLVDQEKPAAGFICASCNLELEELPAGLTQLTFHDLRHSAVSRMISARVPLPIIAKIVGWSSSTMAKMASRYGHFGVEEMRSAVESISSSTIVTQYPQNSPQSASEPSGSIN